MENMANIVKMVVLSREADKTIKAAAGLGFQKPEIAFDTAIKNFAHDSRKTQRFPLPLPGRGNNGVLICYLQMLRGAIFVMPVKR